MTLDEAMAAIADLVDRVETLELAVSALLPVERDPLELNHEAFVAGAVAEARARER